MRDHGRVQTLRRPLSLTRIAAWTGTMVLHLLMIGVLWHHTAVRFTVDERKAMTVDIDLVEATPPPQPKAPAPMEPAATATASVPSATISNRATPPARVASEPVPAAEDALILPEPVAPSMRLAQSRVAVAAEIAEENAPKRRAFAGRPIDAMLPGADSGKLPGFRPKTFEETSHFARQLGKLLQKGVPTAATVYDAPLDLLTEGWENAHHSSDQAECDRRYESFDADLRHQLCGDVRPPQ